MSMSILNQVSAVIPLQRLKLELECCKHLCSQMLGNVGWKSLPKSLTLGQSLIDMIVSRLHCSSLDKNRRWLTRFDGTGQFCKLNLHHQRRHPCKLHCGSNHKVRPFREMEVYMLSLLYLVSLSPYIFRPYMLFKQLTSLMAWYMVLLRQW